MDITPLIPQGRQIITGYGNGGFSINQEFTPGSVIVFADRRLRWDVANAAEITLESLNGVLEADGIDLLLLGTGKSTAMIAPDIRRAFKAKSIACDVMDTGAACRTYNVLAMEERRVAAALLAV